MSRKMTLMGELSNDSLMDMWHNVKCVLNFSLQLLLIMLPDKSTCSISRSNNRGFPEVGHKDIGQASWHLCAQKVNGDKKRIVKIYLSVCPVNVMLL